jgi:hypothetical protein
MSILIVNIGTSDISVKIGDRFFPIGFDRAERNLQLPEVGSLDAELWNNRDTRIREMAHSELGMDLGSLKGGQLPPFRSLTQALLAAYQRDPDTWHPRIRISRIGGFIQHGIGSPNSVSRVYCFVTDQPEQEKFGHPLDTIHAFDIIQLFYKASDPLSEIVFEKKVVDFKAVDEDQLFDYYFEFFQNCKREEATLISTKGGTPQMQAALKIQSIAADLKTLVFLEPKLNISRLLAGEFSEYDRIAYWRYQQTQKYHTVQKLLARWDFAGAVTLLKDWQDTLQSLIDAQVTQHRSELAAQRALIEKVAQGLETAVDCFNLDHRSASERWQEDDSELGTRIASILNGYDLPQALYAQCRIYMDLREIAHFLARMGSFYEATQVRVLESLGETTQNRKNRFEKIQRIRAIATDLSCESIILLWEKLDFWYGIRNDITHQSKGVNEEQIEKEYDNRDILKYADACSYDEILEGVTGLSRDELSFNRVYIYGLIRKWSIEQLHLKRDGDIQME